MKELLEYVKKQDEFWASRSGMVADVMSSFCYDIQTRIEALLPADEPEVPVSTELPEGLPDSGEIQMADYTPFGIVAHYSQNYPGVQFLLGKDEQNHYFMYAVHDNTLIRTYTLV